MALRPLPPARTLASHSLEFTRAASLPSREGRGLRMMLHDGADPDAPLPGGMMEATGGAGDGAAAIRVNVPHAPAQKDGLAIKCTLEGSVLHGLRLSWAPNWVAAGGAVALSFSDCSTAHVAPSTSGGAKGGIPLARITNNTGLAEVRTLTGIRVTQLPSEADFARFLQSQGAPVSSRSAAVKRGWQWRDVSSREDRHSVEPLSTLLDDEVAAVDLPLDWATPGDALHDVLLRTIEHPNDADAALFGWARAAAPFAETAVPDDCSRRAKQALAWRCSGRPGTCVAKAVVDTLSPFRNRSTVAPLRRRTTLDRTLCACAESPLCEPRAYRPSDRLARCLGTRDALVLRADGVLRTRLPCPRGPSSSPPPSDVVVTVNGVPTGDGKRHAWQYAVNGAGGSAWSIHVAVDGRLSEGGVLTRVELEFAETFERRAAEMDVTVCPS